MTDGHALKKLRRHLREEGVTATAGAVAHHVGKTLGKTLEGAPGYYGLRMRLLRRRYDAKALTPVRVSPDEITKLTGECEPREHGHLDYVPYFKPREASWESLPYEAEVPYGAVRVGDWDRTRGDFEELAIYRGVVQRFVEERPWPETDYYRELRDRYRDRGWSEDDAASLARERCDRLDEMHDAISTAGYRSQRALNGNPLHEVTVNVARDGELLYNCEGRHRLSLAKVLDVDEIPVLVLVRHAECAAADGQSGASDDWVRDFGGRGDI